MYVLMRWVLRPKQLALELAVVAAAAVVAAVAAVVAADWFHLLQKGPVVCPRCSHHSAQRACQTFPCPQTPALGQMWVSPYSSLTQTSSCVRDGEGPIEAAHESEASAASAAAAA